MYLPSTQKSCNLLPEETGSVWISQPSDSDEQSYVGCTWGGVSPKYTLPELQEKIDLKESKFSSYAGQCHQMWLLIAGGQFWRPSTWIDLPDGIDEHKFHSSFDKVFFLHDYRSEVKEFLLDGQNRTAQDAP